MQRTRRTAAPGSFVRNENRQQLGSVATIDGDTPLIEPPLAPLLPLMPDDPDVFEPVVPDALPDDADFNCT